MYPYLTKFGIGYGKSDDPYYSYAIGFVIAIIFIIIGKQNRYKKLLGVTNLTKYILCLQPI